MTTVMSPISAAVTSTSNKSTTLPAASTPEVSLKPYLKRLGFNPIPESTIQYLADVITEDEKADVPMKYSETFAPHFGTNGDGRLWYYTGTHWKANDGMEAKKLMRQLIRACSGTDSTHKVEEVCRLTVLKAASIPAPMMGINAQNGFLEYSPATSTWVKRPHAIERGQKYVLSFDYAPEATCDEWLKFLNRVQPDAEIQAYLQDFFGYILLGEARPHAECIAVWIGKGGNGKSVALGVLQALMGKENCSYLSSHELTLGNLEMLVGALANIGSETERPKKLNTHVLKKWASKEWLIADPKYRDRYEFIPTAVPVFAVNDRPVDDRSDGIWRRMHQLNWDISISSDEKDVNLASKLSGELPGILNWALEGARRVLLTGLSVPKAIQDPAQWR